MINNVIFDWSGVVSDDFAIVYEACMHTFDRFNAPRISIEKARREFEIPYMNFWHRYFPDLTKEEQDSIYVNALNQLESAQIYHGMKQVLGSFYTRKIKMAVLSTHPHLKLEQEARSYGINKLFLELKGSVANKTEDIHSMMERHNFLPYDTAFVGDMNHDVETGKSAGIRTIAVTWGYYDKQRLAKANPDMIIDSPSDLEHAILTP